jgi:hypothetical protein
MIRRSLCEPMVFSQSAKAVPAQGRQGEKKPANPEGLQVF